jgi:hypothetical protein
VEAVTFWLFLYTSGTTTVTALLFNHYSMRYPRNKT